MSTFITNDFELLNVSYDNNEFNLLAKDQVGNLYRIREDLGDEDIEIYKPQIVKNKKWKPKRGEPIFVWNVSSSLNEPCCVSYFYSIIYGIIRCEDKHGSCWHHMHKFDPALVGVPRKDWPKAENGEEV